MTMHPYIAEFIGTAILLLLGAGVNANVSLKKNLRILEKLFKKDYYLHLLLFPQFCRFEPLFRTRYFYNSR